MDRQDAVALPLEVPPAILSRGGQEGLGKILAVFGGKPTEKIRHIYTYNSLLL